MPGFEKPKTRYDYEVAHELAALVDYSSLPGKQDRAIPPKHDDRLLLATWNIANLGVQKRREKDYQLIAEILSWFDLIALQEVNDNRVGLRAIQAHLPDRYRVLMSDAGGNVERYVYLYDNTKATPLEKFGELTVPPADLPDIRLPGVATPFTGFDRNPMIATFQVGDTILLLINAHLYFGDEGTQLGMDRRCLEAYAIARWADLRRKSKYAYTRNILALGDFNLPQRQPGDGVYDALTKRGLVIPEHATKVGGSNISDDQHYDQMAVFPGLKRAMTANGVFDFDGAVFRDLWGPSPARQVTFRKYVRYYLSDHRPLWAQLDLARADNAGAVPPTP